MPDPGRSGSIGLVLSGGGARGAYEVGVLRCIAKHRPDLLARVRIISGSSVGAVNGMFLASRGLTPASIEELADLWRSLTIDQMVSLSSLSALKMLGAAPLRLLTKKAKSPARGVLNGEGLWRLVTKSIDWSGLRRHVTSGRFDAITVLGTDLATGRSHAFVEVADGVKMPRDSGEVSFKKTRISRPHVLASAAIPLLFPPIRVSGRWYVDGGVRNNTPFAPALRLGADALLIVNVRGANSPVPPSSEFPGIGQIVGKLLDAIFLDRVGFDLDRLQRINDFVEAAQALQIDASLTQAMVARGRPAYRHIPFAVVSPTRDLGAVAAGYVSTATHVSSISFLRVLDALFSSDAHTSGDGASFLLFDGGYAERLMTVGHEDAEAELTGLDAL